MLPDRRTASVLLTILFFALGLAVVYIARAVIIVFAFSILFAYLIDPVVRFLQRHSLFFKDLRGPVVFHRVAMQTELLQGIKRSVKSLSPYEKKDPGRT